MLCDVVSVRLPQGVKVTSSQRPQEQPIMAVTERARPTGSWSAGTRSPRQIAPHVAAPVTLARYLSKRSAL